MTTEKTDDKKVSLMTPEARASFVHIWQPNEKSKTKDGKSKYQISLLFPPNSNLDALKAAAGACAKEKWGEKVKDIKLKTPFLDAGEYKYEGYVTGWTLIRMTTTMKPGVVGRDAKKLEDETKLYSGCWVRVTCHPFAYDTDGNRGVSFSVDNIQVLRDDAPFSGRVNAEDSFEAVADPEGEGQPASSDELFK